MLTIYCLTYNESYMLPHFVAHYKKLFPTCEIIVCDNESTDGTDKLALQLGCRVLQYSTGNKLSDRAYMEIKNHWWKDAKTDWVAIVDCDEFLQISEKQLKAENKAGASIIRFDGYNMVNIADSDKPDFNTGVRAPMYDKRYMFNRRHITDINYEAGCHVSKPYGYVQESRSLYKCFHYKYMGVDYLIERYKTFKERLSDENKRRGWGVQYTLAADAIKSEFELMVKRAEIIDPKPEKKN